MLFGCSPAIEKLGFEPIDLGLVGPRPAAVGAAGREQAPTGLGGDEHVAELAEAGLVRALG